MIKIGKKTFKAMAWGLLLAWTLFLFEPSGAWGQQGTDLNSRVYQVQQAGVPADVLNRLLTACYTRQVPAESIRGFLDILEAAGRGKLPVRPLVDKVQEGLSKNVDARSIQKALDRMVNDYRMLTNLAVSSSVSGRLNADIMVRLNQSLYSGLTKKELSRLIRQAQNSSWHDLAAAAEFRAALKQYRFDGALAEKMTVSGLKAGFFRNNAWDLLDMVSRARRQNIPDQKIATILLEFVNGRKSYQQTLQTVNEQNPVSGRTSGRQSGQKGLGKGPGNSGSGSDAGGSGNGGGDNGGGNGGGGNGGGRGDGKGR